MTVERCFLHVAAVLLLRR